MLPVVVARFRIEMPPPLAVRLLPIVNVPEPVVKLMFPVLLVVGSLVETDALMSIEPLTGLVAVSVTVFAATAPETVIASIASLMLSSELSITLMVFADADVISTV